MSRASSERQRTPWTVAEAGGRGVFAGQEPSNVHERTAASTFVEGRAVAIPLTSGDRSRECPEAADAILLTGARRMSRVLSQEICRPIGSPSAFHDHA